MVSVQEQSTELNDEVDVLLCMCVCVFERQRWGCGALNSITTL